MIFIFFVILSIATKDKLPIANLEALILKVKEVVTNNIYHYVAQSISFLGEILRKGPLEQFAFYLTIQIRATNREEYW